MAMFGLTVCSLLIGPSELLGVLVESTAQWLILLAFLLMGLMQYFVFVPIIPEMLERAQVDLEIEERDTRARSCLNDKVNDAYGFVYALSLFIGPLIGGFLHDNFGPKTTGDYVAAFTLLFAFFLGIFNCGLQVFEEDR